MARFIEQIDRRFQEILSPNRRRARADQVVDARLEQSRRNRSELVREMLLRLAPMPQEFAYYLDAEYDGNELHDDDDDDEDEDSDED